MQGVPTTFDLLRRLVPRPLLAGRAALDERDTSGPAEESPHPGRAPVGGARTRHVVTLTLASPATGPAYGRGRGLRRVSPSAGPETVDCTRRIPLHSPGHRMGRHQSLRRASCLSMTDGWQDDRSQRCRCLGSLRRAQEPCFQLPLQRPAEVGAAWRRHPECLGDT